MTPTPGEGSGQSSSKATAGVGHPAWGCHMSLSPLSPPRRCYGEPKPRSGVGLEAGALAGGVIGAHYLGLGHHAVLLLREGVAICGER